MSNTCNQEESLGWNLDTKKGLDIENVHLIMHRPDSQI